MQATNTDLAGWETLTDVIVRLGVEIGRTEKQTLGRAVARAWRGQHGTDPLTPVGVKAIGVGTHNLATYPPAFIPEVERLVRTALEVGPERLAAMGPRPPDVEAQLARKRLPDATPRAGNEFWWEQGSA